MKVTFLVLLRNRARMMRGEMGIHSMSAPWARFASMMPTPPVCLSAPPSCLEYRIFSPDVRVSCPESGHRVSQRPSTVMLFFCISVAICAALDVSSIVLTFQVAMLMVVLVSRSFGVVASRGTWAGTCPLVCSDLHISGCN